MGLMTVTLHSVSGDSDQWLDGRERQCVGHEIVRAIGL